MIKYDSVIYYSISILCCNLVIPMTYVMTSLDSLNQLLNQYKYYNDSRYLINIIDLQ